VVRHIQALPEATPLMISAITLGEIEFGLQVSKVSTPEQEASQEALRVFIADFRGAKLAHSSPHALQHFSRSMGSLSSVL
jgi:predicted nucleic acid-binding protein